MLRREYFALEDAPKTNADKVLLVRLEELLSNKKKYFSLYKRAECFLDIDKAFIQAVPRGFKWESISIKIKDLIGKRWQPADTYNRDLLSLSALTKRVKGTQTQATTGWEQDLSQHGYATTVLCHLLSNAMLSKTFNGLTFLIDAATKLKEHYKVTDVLLITKRLSTGVTDDFLVVNSFGEPVRICGVSRISEELRLASLSFPPFFIYIYNTKPLLEGSFPKWRAKFGELLWQAFAAWVKV